MRCKSSFASGSLCASLKAKAIIVGTGYNGAASLNTEAKELVDQIRAKGIEVHIMPTSEAVKLFNKTSKKGLLACFHLNC